MVRSNCVLNHMLIPRVSEVIYYCNYLGHFLSVYFFSIDPQKFIDGSTSSPGCSVINENPGLFKFWADLVKPWITNKGPKAAIWSRGKRNNHAVNLFA